MDILGAIKEALSQLPQGVDVWLYLGEIRDGADREMVSSIHKDRKHANALVAVWTPGGHADAAYRIGRALQRVYKHVTILVHGACKSAGTLLAISGHELVMSDVGELGPLDVQLRDDKRFLGQRSGLEPEYAFGDLLTQSRAIFREHFLEVIAGGGLSTEHALDHANKVTVGLLAPIYGQVEPLMLGEVQRVLAIAKAYGERLDECSKNLMDRALDGLVVDYPSHSFVIDREEAATKLFQRVRAPTPAELALLESIESTGIQRIVQPTLWLLNELFADPTPENSDDSQHGLSEAEAAAASTADTDGVGANAGGASSASDC